MQARVADLDELHGRGLVPSEAQAQVREDWQWRFYAAVHRRMTTGEVDHLIDMQQGTPCPAAAAAAGVAAAACLMEEDRPDEAAALLEEAIDADSAEPVDYAWLSVQLARAYVEIGQLDMARALAASVQGVAASRSM